MSSIHALHIPAGRRTVAVDVVGDHARLEIRPARGRRPDTADTAGTSDDACAAEEPLVVEIPARALVAAVRAAWADVHDARTFEPWRDSRAHRDHRDHRWYGPPGPEDDTPGDLGDGDHAGYRDGSVVPFPRRFPPPPSVAPPPRPPRPRPARSGQPWEPEEEVTIRERWLAASPGADRDGLLAEIAQGLERKAGGVAARLPRVGCDPYRPGCPLDPT